MKQQIKLSTESTGSCVRH